MALTLPSFIRFWLRAVSLLVLLLGASLLTHAQSIRYVKPTATGTGSGSSWANASGNLQAMINASVAMDQVWVAAGTYKPTTGSDRNVSFAMKIGVLIYGGFAGSETSLSQRPVINTTTPSNTILSGDLGTAGNVADNSYHVISNPMDLINTAVLDGFIITGGNANGGSSAGSGGGMYNPGNDSGLGASPTVRNCSFQGNSAGIGGAMTNYGSATSNPVLVNCLFQNNSAIQGGAIYNYKNSGAVGNPVLTNCSFQNNSASTSGGAIFNLGNFSNCAPVLTNCSFQNNSAPQGGAFYNDGNQFYSRPQLNNCVLFGNGGSNAIRNSPDSYVEAIYSLFEADAAFTNGFLGSNVSGVTVNPFASTSSVALNACAPAINSGNNDVYNQYNGTPTDLAGNPRLFPSGGPGTPDRIDMGAVEFQAAPSSITITPPSASFATIGTAFNQTFSASGGNGPYILASGSLPPGITLGTSGVLSGTPTQFGSYTFAVKIADPVTGCSGLSAPYTLSVRSSKPIRYVKAGGTGNGDSWANASGDLQSQIDVAGAEQVWVAAGTYKPGPAGNTDRIISFAMRGGVAIYGGFVGNEATLGARPAINPVRGNPSTTILSGDIGVVGNNADNSYHVILNRDGLTSTAILDGFVITGGNANRDGYSYEGGGGMANICRPPAGAISPTVRNCSFQGNTATHGGAIFNDASGGQQECNPNLINCVFQDNSAGSGGAVSNNASNGTFCSPQFDNCYFINNTADNGGAMENFSGSRSQSNVRLTNCLFQSNSATSTGGAIYNAASGGSSSPVLINCSFQGNSIKAGAGSRLGGAIYFSTSGDITTAMLTNCSFQGNTASQGGAIYVESYQANSTTNINLISCVVFGNGGDGTFLGGRVAQDRYGLIYLSNTLIEASATRYQDRGGNILTNTSPFASPNSPALAANSPAINAGTSDVQGTDVAGNPRIVGCRIDMGAYELQYDPAVAITAQPAASSVVCGRASVTMPVGVSGQYLTYQWYKDSFANPVTGQTSATLTLANVQPANAGSYSLVVTGSCNSLTSTAFNLTVNQPTVSISPVSATICQGKSVLLTASGASTYTWSNTTTGNTLTATTAGTYSVTGVDGNGCSNIATAIVTENKPTVSISPVSATICPGKSVLLTASGASTYTWSNNTTDNTLTATTAGTYSVTGVDGNGCTNTATATITENKPTVSITPNPASICQASSVLLTASGASTGETLSYTWSNNTTSNTLSATTAGTYSVTGVAANGCVNSATATVTDTRPIVSITATPSATVVQGASITLTASGTGATSFAWSSGSTGNSTVINPATSAPYSVTVRNAAGCVTVASLDITVTPVVCGPVIYVTQSGSGQRDGSSWANALGSSQLQFGINTAADCGNNGQVWVAAGTYKPTTGNDRNASFALRNGVTIYGGFVGNETALTDRPAYNPVANRPSSTTLSGDIGTVGNTSDNSFRVINNPASLSLTATAVLDGFVITGGAGGTLGGGMFNDGSSPTLRNCSFVGNSVSASGSTISRGGAIYNGNSSSPQLYNCYFLTNSASSLAGVNGFGGAMANLNSSNPQLTNCNFVNNRVLGNAGNQGGAIANNLNSSPQLINCSFLSNSASGITGNRGGAVANGNGSNPQLINCSFLNNSVSGATSTTNNQGGAVYNNFCTPQLTNCVLFGNGGANTFYNISGGSVVDYSLLETTVTSFTAGTGNLTTDVSPFVSATDTRLNGCSPAINAGDNGANNTATDLDGNPRIYAGTPARIDMGAYEYQGAAGVVTTAPTVNTATVGGAFSQNFTASGGSAGAPDRSYSYSLASGILPPGLSLSNTGVLSGTPTQTGSFTITVSATNTSSCLGVSAPYVLTIIDAASPAPTLAGFTASPGAVCVGSVATFTATVGNVTGSYTYTLTNGLSAPLTGSASGSPFSQSITASGTGTQSFTLTVSANGQSASSVTTLIVNTLPVVSLINNGPLTCAQSSVTLTASGGNSYTFTSGSGVVGTPGSTNTLTVSTPGTYSVTVADASGCVSTTSTSVTSDQNVPMISINPSSATLTCAIPAVSLTAIGTGNVRWNTGETTPVISVSAAGPYSVTLISGNGCSAVATTTVTSDQSAPPVIITAPPSLTITQGQSATLTASGASTYAWSTNENAPAIVVNTAGPYSVTGTASNGCLATASVTLTVSPPACGAGLTGPIWTGCLSTDWNTAGNWASGAVPTAIDDVVIPSAPANQPVLSTTATAKSVEVQSGASLSITVAGSLTINDAKSLDGTTVAFSNRGTVQNAGQLVLGNTAAIGQIGFWNRGIVNNAGGQISIDRSTTSALLNSSGPLTNTGGISIGSNASVGGYGLRVAGGTVANNPGGDITINQAGGLLNDATFVNASRLTIGNVALSAQDGIFTRGAFTNTATGEIRVDRANSNGIWKAGGTFRNDGKILIGTVAYAGFAGILVDGPSFVNSAGAEIQIDRVRRGLTNRSNFTNAGQIRMGNRVALGERGILNGNDEGTVAAVFTNQAGGLIQIDQTASGQDGLANNLMATFTNAGTVAIGTLGSIGGNGISNAGTVSNSACATLSVFAPIINSNSFTNSGLFTVSTTRTHSNTGRLTNNGLFSYPQGNPIPNVVNNDVIAGPISSCSNTFNPALQLGGNSSQFLVGTTWYTDAALTQSAGTYDQGSNTFTATNLALGSSATLYVAATDKANGCTKTVSVSVTLNALTTASISPANPTLTCASPTVSLTASGGSSYRWDDNSTNPVRTVSTSRTYSVTVTNGAGCSAVASASVSQDNTAPDASLASSGPLTCVVNSVTLTARPEGQTGATLAYRFSPGATPLGSSNRATVSSPGLYSVTVISANGCSSVASTSVSQNNTKPVATLSANPSTTLTCSQTQIALLAGGGDGYVFAGPGIVSQEGSQALVNTAGVYSVTVTSSSTGCFSVTSITISQNNSVPQASLTSSGMITCAMSSITLTASPNGLSYAFAGPGVVSQSGNQAVVNTSGLYSVTVSNGSNGCSATASVSVSQDNTAPSVSLVSSGTLSCGVTSVTLTANPNGQAYRFSPGASQVGSSNQATVSSPGLYSVTVINGGNGCTGVASVSVSQNNMAPVATISASPSTTLSCAQTSLTLTAGGGNVYAFSGPGVVNQSGNKAVVNTSGVYSVTVTNTASGCFSVTYHHHQSG